ncbi:MAG: MFS transporter [Alphaproteobacteria bacterium]|nr:MFS transporter [Alphaproteobacteria bacterium]
MTDVAATKPRSRFAVPAWCLFDWANSPFPTVVVTFIFGTYFQKAIIGDEVQATHLWGLAISVSALAVAVFGPILGATVDAGMRRKPWLLAATVLTIVAGGGLWFATPDESSIWLVLLLVALSNFGFELGMVFYNAMLPELAPRSHIGRISGWAWGLGYAGGLACLVLALFALVRAEPPPFGLDTAMAEEIRAVAPLVVLWLVLFGWPLFVFTPETHGDHLKFGQALRKGIAALGATFRNIRGYANIARFLIARMFYIDGLNTLFAFGGVYAAGSFGMDFEEVLIFAIALNVTAGIGAFLFAWVDDWIGAKPTLVISLVALIASGAAILLVEDKLWFWVLGLVIGIFMGPTQSSSRSMMARLAPPHMMTEMFGLFALSGKATAFLGPLLVGMLTLAADSQRVGMSVILGFFILGLLLLFTVREPREESA